MRKLIWSFIVAATLTTGAVAQAQEWAAPGVRIRVAPPRLREEVRPAAPSPRHVWAAGHWGWEGGRHVWQGGRWLEPRPGHMWVDGRWVPHGGEYVFYPGHWAPIAVGPPPAPAGEVYSEYAPPPEQVEAVPVAPSPEHMWIKGHWFWRGGRWEWLPGRYELRRAGMRWEHPRWVEHGGRWRYEAGGWRR